MSSVLADTHVLIWYLFEPTRLSPAADAELSAAVGSGILVYTSAISLVEIRYLIEKGRLPAVVWSDTLAAIDDPAVPVQLLPVDSAVARAVERVSRLSVPDMPDRVIAATAVANGLVLVTADHMIRASTVPTIW